MDKYEDREVIVCPVCRARIFPKNVSRHFWLVHDLDLSLEGKTKILAEAEKYPLTKKKVADHLKRLEDSPKKKRTPASMRQHDGMRTGPLGPGRG